MLPLQLAGKAGAPLTVLAVGAHPDDIEIGSGGTLLALCAARQLAVHYLVLTGSPERKLEARRAASSFLDDATTLTVDLRDLPEGRLPAAWQDVKDVLESVAASVVPDLVLGPSPDDAHQDHRTIGEILPSVFRDGLHLAYEIPKWDGDVRRPSVYVPLPPEVARAKVDLLHKCFPSQATRDWWDDEVFLGLARLRGMECRSRYAEAFTCTKAVLLAGAPTETL